MRRMFFAVLLILSSLAGCRLDAGKETQNVKDAVIRYNDLLARGYAGMDMTRLREAATDEQAQKVYFHMAALGESKIRMETELKDLNFLEVQFPKRNFARAKTREVWNYAHINSETGAPVKAVQGLVYRLTYEIVRKDGRWLVSAVHIEDEQKSAADTKTGGKGAPGK